VLHYADITYYSDGKKMSKRLKNYPDPREVVDKHGADALRHVKLVQLAAPSSTLS